MDLYMYYIHLPRVLVMKLLAVKEAKQLLIIMFTVLLM